jgi:hypothetical protein
VDQSRVPGSKVRPSSAMADSVSPDVKLEIGHVLFIDIPKRTRVSAAVSRQYTHLSTHDLRAAMQRLPDVTN